MPSYSRYIEKRLYYVIILTLFSHQFSSYTKYTRANIRSSYNIKLVSNTKYAYLIRFYIL